VSHGAHWAYLDKPSTSTQLSHKFDTLRGIRDRRRVRHRVDSGETARSRRTRTGENRFRRLTARFAQVRVQVDKSGECHKTGAVDNPICLRCDGPDLSDHTIVNQDVGCSRS
jgi:hypothetical protein